MSYIFMSRRRISIELLPIFELWLILERLCTCLYDFYDEDKCQTGEWSLITAEVVKDFGWKRECDDHR